MGFLDAFFRVPHGSPPIARGIEQAAVVVIDEQIDRRLGAAFEDDHVQPGVLHFVAEEAARIGARDGAGQRPLGDHRIAPGRGGRGAGQRSGRHDQLVFRRKRIDLGVDLFRQVLGRQATLPQVTLGPIHVEGFMRAGALGQVDPQNPPCPCHDIVLPVSARLAGRRRSSPPICASCPGRSSRRRQR